MELENVLDKTKREQTFGNSLLPFLEGHTTRDEGRVSGLSEARNASRLTVAGQPRTRLPWRQDKRHRRSPLRPTQGI